MTDLPTPEQDERWKALRATADPAEFEAAFPTLFGAWTIELYVPKGWRDVVWRACEQLVRLGVTVVQVKEKFGTLRIYLGPFEGEQAAFDEAQAIVGAAEEASAHLCQTCGATNARQHGPGWYYTACDEHLRQSDEELLAAVEKERGKFTQQNEGWLRAAVAELVLRGVYPAGWGSVPKEQWDPYQRMQGWGARWHEWREPLACPHCKSDLRNLVSGPPGKREIGHYSIGRDVTTHYSCPDCGKTIPRVSP